MDALAEQLGRTGKGRIKYYRGSLESCLDEYDLNLIDVSHEWPESAVLGRPESQPSPASVVCLGAPSFAKSGVLDHHGLDSGYSTKNLSCEALLMMHRRANEIVPPGELAANFMRGCLENVAVLQIADEEVLGRRRREKERMLVPGENPVGTDDDDVRRRLEALAERSRRQHEAELETKLQLIHRQQEQEKRKQDEENTKRILDAEQKDAKLRLSVCVQRIRRMWKVMEESVMGCKDRTDPNLLSKIQKMKELKNQYNTATNKLEEAANQPSTVAVECETVAGHMEELGQSICGTVEEIAKRIADAELAKKIADEELAKQLSDKAREAEKPPPAPVQPQEKPPTQESAEADDCVHPEQLALYEQVLAEHEQHKALFAKMLTDVNLKKFRFDCQKAVNTPVNAISPASASHLQDKLDRLRNLLQGRSIVIDERSFSASQHPGGIEYCLELLSKKLVNQGEDVVSRNAEAAFAIAAVIVALWVEFPVLGRLILAHFYRKCPYLIPYYMDQKQGQSDTDHYKQLGYEYSENGQIESQDKFLKRMSGLVRLYAAILITDSRRNQAPNPHGLGAAWRFLAAVLNMPPRGDITTTVLLDLLQVTAFKLAPVYGRQFRKLVHLLCTEYFALIRGITDASGPVSRLDEWLQKALRRNAFEPPQGVLAPNFW